MRYVYILRCSDNSFYTGVSSDIKDRLKRHNSGTGSSYSRTRRPIELVYLEEVNDRTEAIKREIEIKKFGVKNKKRLIKFVRSKGFLKKLIAGLSPLLSNASQSYIRLQES